MSNTWVNPLIVVIKMLIFNLSLGFSKQNQQPYINAKGALSGLMQFLETESPLKRMKNAF